MRCWFGHKWTRWEQYKQEFWRATKWYPEPIKSVEVWQKRRCERCGKMQREEV